MNGLKTLGIIGLGTFGTFVGKRATELLPRVKVSGWDIELRTEIGAYDATVQSDAVVFAVPPASYVQALREFVPKMRPDGVIVDVCTVKMVTVAALREVADGRPYIATHPMFGRQSFIDHGHSLRGLQLVVCEHTLGAGRHNALVTFLTQCAGLEVVTMTPEEHDNVQAREQLLTQHVGCVIKRAGFQLNPRRIHTVSAQYFYRAMKIVGNDEELFKQAAALNPFWPKVLAEYELAEAQHRLEMLNGK